MREQSADQVKRILQLEEKERMLATVEGHLASFKQQAAQLEEQLLQEQRSNDRLEFEAKKAGEERDRLAADKQVGHLIPVVEGASLFIVSAPHTDAAARESDAAAAD